MATTITRQTLIDGEKNLVVKVTLVGDGQNESTNDLLIDASSYTPAATDLKLCKVIYALDSFSATLEWDATANVDILTLVNEGEFCFPDGLPNNAGSGVTGDIDLSTNGISSNKGFMVLYFEKN